jgi:hypothetical protein
MVKHTKDEIKHAQDRLMELLPKANYKVSTVLRHVSRSGMMRHISLFVAVEGEVIDITYYAAVLLGDNRADDGGIKITGCGMDMGFSLVYNLSRTLWPNGFDCIGEGDGSYSTRCPSNDHANGDRNYTPHHHSDSGYLLKHHWI